MEIPWNRPRGNPTVGNLRVPPVNTADPVSETLTFPSSADPQQQFSNPEESIARYHSVETLCVHPRRRQEFSRKSYGKNLKKIPQLPETLSVTRSRIDVNYIYSSA